MRGAKGLGQAGESLVAAYLEGKGYTILARNYHSRWGEIDLIAGNGTYLAFVEVKLRRNGRFSAPREAVNQAKQNKLRQTALMYLSERELDSQPRFDVAEVYLPVNGEAKIEYYEDAFQ